MRSQSSSKLAKENKTIDRRSLSRGWCRFCIVMWDILQKAAEKMVAVERADEKLAGGSDEEAGGQS